MRFFLPPLLRCMTDYTSFLYLGPVRTMLGECKLDVPRYVFSSLYHLLALGLKKSLYTLFRNISKSYVSHHT
jgi:hypothetical protein